MLRSFHNSYIPSSSTSWDDEVVFRQGSDRISLRESQKHMEVPADLYSLSQYVASGVPLQDMSAAFQRQPSMSELGRVQSGVDLLSESEVITD